MKFGDPQVGMYVRCNHESYKDMVGIICGSWTGPGSQYFYPTVRFNESTNLVTFHPSYLDELDPLEELVYRTRHDARATP